MSGSVLALDIDKALKSNPNNNPARSNHMEISELLRQRKLTRAVAQLFHKELGGYLKAVTPLINPRPVFGEHIHGAARVSGTTADKALADLRSQYEKVHAAKSFSLRKQFDTPVALLSATLELTPLTYRHIASGEAGDKAVTVISPLRWVVSYAGFGPNRLRELLAGTGDGQALQQTVLHNLLLSITLRHKPELSMLFEALRFPLSVEQHAEFGPLPMVVVSSPLTTYRPPDDIIIESTEISGTSDFEEIADPDQIDDLADPLRDKIRRIVD